MSYQYITVTTAGAIAKVTMNRPEVLNAVSMHMAQELLDALEKLHQEKEIRAVILSGNGRAFSAGGDVKQMRSIIDDNPAQYFSAPLEVYNQLIMAMRRLPKPLIAAVNGMAAGAGFSLALACDVRIAAENAKFTQAFVRIGLVPDCGATFFLPRIVGWAKAMELMMTGELIDAAKAQQLGIVNLVVKEDELASTADFFANQATNLPTMAVARLKELMDTSYTSTLAAQLEREARLQIECAATADFAEGVKAFTEKRAAQFKGE
jgi:2-(1,2-epoxy-1,2-dihydrophenyl)acetyl-CoA isomerase